MSAVFGVERSSCDLGTDADFRLSVGTRLTHAAQRQASNGDIIEFMQNGGGNSQTTPGA